MKKLISLLLALAMLVTLTACGSSQNNTTVPTTGEATQPTDTDVTTDTTTGSTSEAAGSDASLEELLNQVITISPVEFMGGVVNLDLADTSDDGLWNLKRYTGLDSADGITEAAAFEPMMGSIAFSMVMVRVAEGGDVKAVAEAMKNGIDPAKWICVMADDIQVAGSGNVVMFIMVDTFAELASQPFVDAFSTVMGGTDFVM